MKTSDHTGGTYSYQGVLKDKIRNLATNHFSSYQRCGRKHKQVQELHKLKHYDGGFTDIPIIKERTRTCI